MTMSIGSATYRILQQKQWSMFMLHLAPNSVTLSSLAIWLDLAEGLYPSNSFCCTHTGCEDVQHRSVLVWVCHGSLINFTVIHRSVSIPSLSFWESADPQGLREPCAAFPYLLLAMRVSSQGFQLSAPSVLSQAWASLVPRYGQTFYPELHKKKKKNWKRKRTFDPCFFD